MTGLELFTLWQQSKITFEEWEAAIAKTEPLTPADIVRVDTFQYAIDWTAWQHNHADTYAPLAA